MKKDKLTKDFDAAFDGYFSEKNPILHKKAIQNLLKKVDLKYVFDELLSEKNDVSNFFLMWERAGKSEKKSANKKRLQRLGKLSKEFYSKKEYEKLYELFFNIMFRSLAEFANLEARDDFEKMTNQDLYEKNIIPSEIFFQYFLIESPVKMKDFDWNKNEEIMKQNLACLIVCFGDIHEFFHEENFEK
ncbi:MAG: hypothetical protein KAI57_04870 [Candidatus Pacebacteria bacterium]|nr:hypothetical protein [Candidatus Paceibacterota bacterium]